MNMPSKQYNSKLFKVINSLERDLAENKITEGEFKVLLGMFIQREFSRMVDQQINELLPSSQDKSFGARFINYQWKRTFNHV